MIVLVDRDVNTQRMYLHSVITKESLLRSSQTGAFALQQTSDPGSVIKGGVFNILRDALNYKQSAALSPSRQSVADALARQDFKQEMATQMKFKLADIIAPGNGFNGSTQPSAPPSWQHQLQALKGPQPEAAKCLKFRSSLLTR